jgi:hypothetical protein
MAIENPDRGVQALWQRQEQPAQDFAVVGVRRRAETIDRTARRRALVLWISIVNNVAICAWLAWSLPHTRPYVAVFFLAVSFAQVQGLTRSTTIMVPADAGLMTSLAFLRTSLERERSLMARAWLWFLLPAGIGELALGAGMLAAGTPVWRVVLPLAAGVAALFAFVFIRSRQRGRTLQREIDRLREVDGGERP